MPEPTVARRPGVLVSVLAAATLGMLASTIYVPSIPAIVHGLGTTAARVQLTFVGYLLAFAIGMLALGPLSDRYGRRRTMIFGMALSTLASLACAASPTIGFLIAARIAQGIGACAGMVVGRATIRDLYGRDGAAQVIAALAIAATLVQSFAPIPGGYLQAWIGWRANFAAVALYAAAATTLAILYVPETHTIAAAARQMAAKIAGNMLATYRQLAGTRRFMAYALAATGAHAGFHIFTAGAPSVLIGGFGISPEAYGFYAALPPIGFLAGSFLSNRLTRRLGIDSLIVIGSIVLVPAGAVMVALALLHVAGPYTVVGPMVFICCASGLITPNAVAGSLGVSAANVGAASGLASFLQMTGAAAATAALSLGSARSPVVLAVVTAAAGVFAVCAFGSLIVPAPHPEKADSGAPI
ncbi:MAG: Bcr/CflA family efflux MFS transporter [Stellaceae bacterium]